MGQALSLSYLEAMESLRSRDIGELHLFARRHNGDEPLNKCTLENDMNESFTNLRGRNLRTRIDGMNFTQIGVFKDLSCLDKQDENSFKQSLLLDAAKKFRSVFEFDSKVIDITKNRLTIDLNSELGLFIEGYFKEIDLFLVVQFKGFFFIKDDAFDLCRSIMLRLTSEFNEVFRLTLVDVAQDFLVSVDDLLPNPSKRNDSYRCCFKFRTFYYHDNTSSEGKFTGFVIHSSRYKITIYDKLAENQKARNLQKKEYYEHIYAEFSDKHVTRIELRIKQEFCRPLTSLFFRKTVDEANFIKECLYQIYKKHKLRFQLPSSQDKDWRRWPVHPNWDYIFGGEGSLAATRVSSADYRYTSGKQNVDKSLHLLIETLVGTNPQMSKKELIEKIECINLDSVISRVQSGHLKRIKTIAVLESFKNQTLESYRNSTGLDPSDWGSL